jgi:TolB-like protein
MAYLDQAEKAQLETLRETQPFANEVLRQCARILDSHTFSRTQKRARDFLSFVVAKKLLGREAEIKETTIAIHVHEEPTDYDPAESSTIRVAAAALRHKLVAYYTIEGQRDPVEIRIPRGQYIPEILDRRVVIAIADIENWNPERIDDHLCTVVRDEIARNLRGAGPIEVQNPAFGHSLAGAARYSLRGTLESRENSVRLNICLTDLEQRRIVFGRSFEGPRDGLLKISVDVAKHIVAALRPPEVRQQLESPSATISRTRTRRRA